MKVLETIGVLLLILQLACSTKSQSPQNANDRPSGGQTASEAKEPKSKSPPATDLSMASWEAQELRRKRIVFAIWENVDGGRTEEIPASTGHTYISTDGVEINTSIGLYKTSRLSESKYAVGISNAKEILERTPLLDNKQQKLGERLVASTEGGYLIAARKGQSCTLYESSSLAHLLAFEKWRDSIQPK